MGSFLSNVWAGLVAGVVLALLLPFLPVAVRPKRAAYWIVAVVFFGALGQWFLQWAHSRLRSHFQADPVTFSKQNGEGVNLLVADIHGPETDRYRVTEFLLKEVYKSASELDGLSVKALRRPITEQEGRSQALRLGMQANASHVLWGWYSVTNSSGFLSLSLVKVKSAQGGAPDSVDFSSAKNSDDFENYAVQGEASKVISSTVATISGLTHYWQRDFEKAAKSFTVAIDGWPSDHVLSRAGPLFYRGNSYSRKGFMELALRDYEEVIRVTGGEPNAYLNRGNVLQSMARFEEAIASYNSALSAMPTMVGALIGRGSALHLTGKYQEAIADYNKAEILGDRSVELFVNRGNVYSDSGNYSLAISEYRRALSVDSRQVLAYQGLANAYLYLGQGSKAMGPISRAIELRPNDPNLYTARAKIHIDQNSLDRAEYDLKQALRLDAVNLMAITNLGVVRLRQGQVRDALMLFTKVLDREPDHLYARFSRGFLLVELGEGVRGREDLERVVRSSPNSDLGRRAKETLAH